jgi:hypothetical protein
MSVYSRLGAKLVCEWDSRDASTIFEDTSGTDPAENADGVACWKTTANSATAANLIQATALSRPIYTADVGDGLPGLDFDGSADHLIAAHASALNVTSAVVVAVITPDVINAFGGIITKDFDAFSNGYSLTVRGDGTAGYWWGPDAYNRCAMSDSTTGTRCLLVGIWNGTSSIFLRNSSKVIAVQAGANGTDTGDLYVGRAFNGGFYFNGRIHHLMICSDLSVNQVCDMQAYLMDFWGIAGGPDLPSGGVSGFTGLSGVGRLGT